MSLAELHARYERDGYVGGVQIVTESAAANHRACVETAEAQMGPLHYLDKMHTILTSPYELATHPNMLETVEALIGPDILLYNVVYIVKEPGSAAHVAWHQDLTYWGLSSDQQVSAWLALAPATEESGCMMMIPGSHTNGLIPHITTSDDTNVLDNGQQVTDVDESAARLCPLAPGEASFHHGLTLHSSRPNTTKERRIGLNIQYLAPSVCQTNHNLDTAMLVRGTDEYGNFGRDTAATSDLDAAALHRRAEMGQLIKGTYAELLRPQCHSVSTLRS